jgi:hypothetical protein
MHGAGEQILIADVLIGKYAFEKRSWQKYRAIKREIASNTDKVPRIAITSIAFIVIYPE